MSPKLKAQRKAVMLLDPRTQNYWWKVGLLKPDLSGKGMQLLLELLSH